MAGKYDTGPAALSATVDGVKFPSKEPKWHWKSMLKGVDFTFHRH